MMIHASPPPAIVQGLETAPPRARRRIDPFGAVRWRDEMRALAARGHVPQAMASDDLQNLAIGRIGAPSRWIVAIPLVTGGSGGAFSVLIAGAERGRLVPLATIQAPQGHARPFVQHDGTLEILTPVEDVPNPAHLLATRYTLANGVPRAAGHVTVDAASRPATVYGAFTAVAVNEPPRATLKTVFGESETFRLTPSEPPFVDPLRIMRATYHFDAHAGSVVLDGLDDVVIR